MTPPNVCPLVISPRALGTPPQSVELLKLSVPRSSVRRRPASCTSRRPYPRSMLKVSIGGGTEGGSESHNTSLSSVLGLPPQHGRPRTRGCLSWLQRSSTIGLGASHPLVSHLPPVDSSNNAHCPAQPTRAGSPSPLGAPLYLVEERTARGTNPSLLFHVVTQTCSA